MPTREDLDRARVVAVTGDPPMIVAVGANQIGEHLGVTSVGLRASNIVTVAVTRDRERVDRVHLIAGRDQRLDPQAAIGLDADHHLSGFISVIGDELMERANPRKSLRQSSSRELLAALVHQMNVVMIFCPVVTDEQHPGRLPSPWWFASRRATSGDLMDQCSEHDTPSALTQPSPTSRDTI